MSIERIHLRKLLVLLDAPPRDRRRLLLEDIATGRRSELRKKEGMKNDGGDFYGPFWADAKSHAAGGLDLTLSAQGRVDTNPRRKRLYPILAKSFLQWWDEKRRWRNEPFEEIPQNVKAQFPISELNGVIKIEGLMAVRVVGLYDRIIYPYFCETRALSPFSTRVGLWILGKALPRYGQQDLRILDVFRSASFGIGDRPFDGKERGELIENYSAILAEWEKLKNDK